jgi:hypothetical protein
MSKATSRKRNTGHVSNRGLWLSLSILPLVILGLDLALFPRIFERRQLVSALDATTLFENRLVPLGTIHSVSLNAALERLKDDDSLAYLSKRKRSGLVTSVFVDSGRADGERVFEGELSRAVGLRLQSLSESLHLRMIDFIAGMGERQAGDVLGLDLNLSDSERARFPVDRLIVVVLNPPGSKENGIALETALAGVVADADGADLKALALPCIGYQWDEKNSVSFDQIFRSAFKALKGSHRPFDMFISLYSDWPTSVVEKAVAAVNLAWTAGEGTHPGLLSSLYRGRYRILLLLTTICLLACTRRAQNTVKSFLLILGAYLGAAFGLAELLDRFTKNYPQQPVEITVVTLWVVLALGFPIFAGWDLKDVFPHKKSNSSKRHPSPGGSVRSAQSHDSELLDGAENVGDVSRQRRGISKVNRRRNRDKPPQEPAASITPRTSGQRGIHRKTRSKSN